MAKGLSVEEKRTKLLELFHETCEFYKLVELEKLAPKLKGITMQTVKEILQSLVDDNLVSFDKIGAGNYYWSFPSAESTKAINTLAAKEMSQAALQLELRTAQEEIAALRVGREDNEERRTMLRQIKEAERALGGLEKTQAQFWTCDPVFFARKESALRGMQQSALESTEKAAVALSYVSTKYGSDAASQLRHQLEIPDDFEDLSF